MWNNVPKIVDYIVCGIELILWIIYVVLQSKTITPETPSILITFIYGILNVISYFTLAILFFQFKRRLHKFGEGKLTPLSKKNNNTEVQANDVAVEVREHD
ncbi:hypothetical protein GLOIN_2v1761388 [Rhizophagus clarus]|nr:hypothetical protein GLOIN_2v1761388 [Rhizophagus clarus]